MEIEVFENLVKLVAENGEEIRIDLTVKDELYWMHMAKGGKELSMEFSKEDLEKLQEAIGKALKPTDS